MNRSTLLAGLLLLVLGVVFTATPHFSTALPFPPPILPEQLPSAEFAGVSKPFGLPAMEYIGRGLIVLTSILLLVWRRSVGQGPFLALLPSLVVLFHPAFYSACGSLSGLVELACFFVAILSIFLMTFGRSAAAVVGAILGFLVVLIAPSGAPLAALFAFAFAEAAPGLPGAAIFATLYGVARAFALPSLVVYLKSTDLANLVAAFAPLSPPEAPLAAESLGALLRDGSALLSAIAATAAGTIPTHLPLFAFAPDALIAGSVLLGWLGLGVVVFSPEKRFGGRSAPLLALVAMALLAIEQARRGLASSVALAAPIVIVATYVAVLADAVDGRRVRRAIAILVAVAIVAYLGFARGKLVPAVSDRAAFARQIADPSLAAAERSTASRIAFVADLAASSSAAIHDRAKARLVMAPPSTASGLEIDRALALESALTNDSESAVALLQRALAHATLDSTARERSALRLDLLDLLLRARKSRDVVDWCAEMIPAESSASLKAELLAREASGHVQLAAIADPKDVVPAEKEWAAASVALDAAIAADDHCARAFFDRGRLAMVRGDGVAAVKDLERAGELATGSAQPAIQLALFYLSRAQESTALRYIETARKLAGESDPEIRLLEAQRAIGHGEVLVVEKAARELEAVAPRLLGGSAAIGDLYAMLASAAEDQHNDGLALASCRAASRLRGDRDGRLAAQEVRLLKRALAYEDLTKLLLDMKARRVEFPDLDQEIAIAYKNDGLAALTRDKARARAAFFEAVHRSPSYADLGSVPGLLRSLTLEAKLPEDTLIDEGKRAYEYGVARASGPNADLEIAERALQVSRALVPGNPYVTYQLALLRKAKGQTAEMKSLLEETIRAAEALGSPDLVKAAQRELGP